jgi:hypothetical protein
MQDCQTRFYWNIAQLAPRREKPLKHGEIEEAEEKRVRNLVL